MSNFLFLTCGEKIKLKTQQIITTDTALRNNKNTSLWKTLKQKN